MRPAIALLLMLLLALIAGAVGLWLLGRPARRIRARVKQVGFHAATSSRAKPERPHSISLMDDTGPPPLVRLLQRMVAYSPHGGGNGGPVKLAVVAGLAAAAIAAWSISAMFGRPLAAVLAPVVGVLAMRFIFGRRRRQYREDLFHQMPDALGQIVRAVRAGLPVNEALRGVARELPAPTSEEFTRVVSEISIGQSMETALLNLYERSGLTEYAFFAVTLGLQSQTGGSLAETLENLADMVRKRVAMTRKTHALAAEANASAKILSGLPFVAGVGLALVRPGYLDAFLFDPLGQRLLAIAVGFLLTGTFVLKFLIAQALAD